MRKFLFPDTTSLPASVGLLILRLISGGAMLQHGWGKMQAPFTWMDGMGPGMPGFLQALAALAEFGGGIAIVLGLLTPLAALGWVVTMAVATWKVQSGGATWVSAGGGGKSFESSLLYLGVAVLFLVAGPGALSLDHFLLNGRRRGGGVIAGR